MLGLIALKIAPFNPTTLKTLP